MTDRPIQGEDLAPLAALLRIADLHQPEDVDVDVEWDENKGKSAGCNDFCRDDRSCPGHSITIKACSTCLRADVDGYALYHEWPCATARIAQEVTADVH